MTNVTMTNDLFLRSAFARDIAGLFTWAALIITSYQVLIKQVGIVDDHILKTYSASFMCLVMVQDLWFFVLSSKLSEMNIFKHSHLKIAIGRNFLDLPTFTMVYVSNRTTVDCAHIIYRTYVFIRFVAESAFSFQ